MNPEVYVWQWSNFEVGGGGSQVKVYSSLEKAIAGNPGEWYPVDSNLWRRN